MCEPPTASGLKSVPSFSEIVCGVFLLGRRRAEEFEPITFFRADFRTERKRDSLERLAVVKVGLQADFLELAGDDSRRPFRGRAFPARALPSGGEAR